MSNSRSLRAFFVGSVFLVLSSLTQASPVQPMNLDVDRVDVSAALRLVADFAELNLILADDVKG